MHASECLLYIFLLNCVISIGGYTSVNKFYSFITYRHFSLLNIIFATNIIWTLNITDIVCFESSHIFALFHFCISWWQKLFPQAVGYGHL